MAHAPYSPELIRRLEARLFNPAVRGSADALDTLLAAEFVEFGKSGPVWRRAETIAAVSHDPAWQPSQMSEVEVRELAQGVALITYRATRTMGSATTETLRSSIWTISEGGWKMVFHQGTPAP